MKKIKLLLLTIFVAIISTGCTLNYNLTINEDRGILESVVVTEKNSILKTKFNDYKKEIKEQENYYKEHQLYFDYTSKKIYGKTDSGLSLSKRFEYGTYNNSPNKNSVFNNYAFYEQEGNYIFRLTYPIYEAVFPDTNDLNQKIDEAYINIKSHLKVLETNSDSYDEKTKTYTWKLDQNFFNNSDGIYIKLSKEKDNMLIFKDFIMNNLTTITIVSSVILLILIFGIHLFKSYKNGMKI